MLTYALLSLLALGQAKVVEVKDSDIGQYLYRGIPTIIDIYASWCGHCKTYAPVFDQIAAKYDHLGDEIQFLKADGDKNRKISRRFNVKYFPTINFIDADDKVEELDDRDMYSLERFIKNRVGLIPDSLPKPKQGGVEDTSSRGPKISREDAEFEVLTLIDDDFEEIIRGKNALVSFTTEWCQYCKAMAPEWEKLARLYAHDDNIVIANVDCSDLELTYGLTEVFGIEAFPTVMFFSENDKEEEPSFYSGGRSFESFVEFIQQKGISDRSSSGTLNEAAGVIPDLDLSVIPNYKAVLKQVEDSGSKYAEVYTRVLTKAIENSGYLANEAKRLQNLLNDSDKLSSSVIDSFNIKLNIIKSLLGASERPKEEL